MSVLERFRTDESAEVPDLATYQAERPSADTSARGPHYYPGISRAALDVMAKAEQAAGIAYERTLIQNALGPDPLSAEPLALKDYADVLRGAWTQHTRFCLRADDARGALVRRHLDAVRLPALRASQDLATAIDLASMDADGVREAFAAEAAAIEEAYVESAAEWIAAGAEETELNTVQRARELWFAGLLATDDGNPNQELGRAVLAAAEETGAEAAV